MADIVEVIQHGSTIEVVTTKEGIPGRKGDKGDKPAHVWDGTKLQFENPDGTFDVPVDLKGEKGDQGIQGLKGDKPAHTWNGTQLQFENPDGTPGIPVDLKGEKGDTGNTGPQGKPGAVYQSTTPTADQGVVVWVDPSDESQVWDESQYARKTEVATLQNEFLSHKTETATKVATVEKELKDYQKAMQEVNINQEATQKVSGFGIVSLPKNAANGQFNDVRIKGNTRTNLIKSSNMDKDTNSDGVVDDFTKWVAPALTANVSYDAVEKAQKVEITGGTDIKHIEINQYVNISAGDTISGQLYAKIQGNIRLQIDLLWYTDSDYLSISSGVSYTGSGYVENFNKIAPSGATRVLFAIRIFPTAIGATGTVWLKNAILEKASSVGSYISSGTKSTLSAMRLKSIGKNLFDKNKLILNETVNILDGTIIANSAYARTGKQRLIQSGSLRATNFGDASQSGLAYYDSSGNFISGTSLTYLKTNPSIIPANAVYFDIAVRVDTQNLDTVQLEYGTLPTPYEPYTESEAYIQAFDADGKPEELLSVPSTKDKVSVTDGKKIQNVNTLIMTGNEITQMGTWLVEVDIAQMQKPLDSNIPDSSVTAFTVEGRQVSPYKAFTAADIGKVYADNVRICFVVAKGTTLAQAREQLAGTKITYQLAQPVDVPIQVSGTIICNPSGTIYAEPIIADAGLYTDSMAILYQDLPIKRLDRLSVVDFLTGVETEIDVSQAVIAVDGLSFTHPELADGDIVFFEYEYEYDGTVPEIEAEYYDSRIVKEDKSVPGKFYKIEFEVNNGVVTPIAVEV